MNIHAVYHEQLPSEVPVENTLTTSQQRQPS